MIKFLLMLEDSTPQGNGLSCTLSRHVYLTVALSKVGFYRRIQQQPYREESPKVLFITHLILSSLPFGLKIYDTHK